MSRRAAHPVSRQHGQAMVEFLVAALFFLLPLFLAIAVLGKFSDVQHTTQMAGRYAAWERTVWYDDTGSRFDTLNGPNRKSDADIGHEIGVRLINDHSQAKTVIRNTDRNATTFANGIDPMWHDNAHTAYLQRYEQQDQALSRETPGTDLAGKAVSTIGNFSAAGFTGSMVPPLPSDNLAVATVSFRQIAKDSAAYQRLWPRDSVWRSPWNGVDFSSTAAILSNTWSANGSGATRAMVGESVPMSKGLGDVLGTVEMGLMHTWELTPPKAEFGKIAPDVVPGDRLR